MKLLRGTDAEAAVAKLAHRYASFDLAVEIAVAAIVGDVRSRGDEALFNYARRYDIWVTRSPYA